jgi:hypothetical protein
MMKFSALCSNNMKLGRILSQLEIGDRVVIVVENTNYEGNVVDQGYTESKPDPVKPWYDPGGASAIIELDQSTVENLDLHINNLRVSCGQFEDFPTWKTPIAALYQDGEEKEQLGEVDNIITPNK